ncbi:MAG TPA: V-type ATPase subunit [Candidatus Methanofastidiosa archaeon]|nr:V-type ATPase subunit [Candidatus Methanofastidiosa archaeon]
MRRWDVENVKSILRGLQSGASSNEITETLIPVGAIKFTYLIELTKMNYDSAKADLIEKNIIPAGIDTLSELEYEMDKIYFQESLDIATDVGEKDLIRYLSLEVDLYNVKIIMRLKNAGADFNIIRKDLILLGKRITKEFLNRIKDLSYGETVNFLNKEFHDLRLDPNGPVTVSERQLEKYLIMFGERISHLNMFSTLTALGFILKKYREIANLRLIVRGKQLGIDSDSIEKMLVV